MESDWMKRYNPDPWNWYEWACFAFVVIVAVLAVATMVGADG